MIISILLFTAGCAEQTAADVFNPNDGENTPEVKPADNGNDSSISDIPDDSDNAGENTESVSVRYEDGFVFTHNGTDIYMGEYINNILPALGPELNSFDSDSCVFDGVMKTYTYGGFDILGYAKTESEEYRVFSVTFHDDSVATAEGIYIGHAIADMTAAYGEPHEESPGFYSKYIKNGTTLTFDFDGGAIIAITYSLINI